MSSVSVNPRPLDAQAELDEFAKRLSEMMARAGMSQSDLARELWGSTQDTRGRDVARNRDRISLYIRGLQMPEPKTLKRIAAVFNTTPTALSPALALPPPGRVTPLLTLVSGRDDLATGYIHQPFPLKVALQLAAVVSDYETTARRDAKTETETETGT